MINIKNVHKSFGNREILKGIDLTVSTGSVTAILGPSGSGKTTFLRTLNFLEKADQGTMELNDIKVDLKTASNKEILNVRRNTSMVFQSYNLFSNKTVIENIMEGLVTVKKMNKSAAREIAQKFLKEVGMEGFDDYYPVQLSGGQQQRIGIARALAMDPQVILFDEPTSALDPDTTESILQLLERVNRELGVTVVIVTHEIDVIQKICNRVVVMEHGKLIESGSVLEVFSKPKHETTKRFVRTVIPDEIPSTVKHTLACDKRPYTILKMHFLGNNTTDNVLYHINKTFDLETSVLFATVTELEHTVLGIFIVQFIGDDLEVGKVKEYLVAQGIEWQEVTL